MSHPSAATDASEIWCKTLSYVLIGFFLYAIPLSVFAALPVPADNTPALRIHGSNTIGAELAPALIKGLLQKEGFKHIRTEPGAQMNEHVIRARNASGPVSITLAAHGSTTGFTALLNGQGDIAAASRPIKAEEVQRLQSMGNFLSREGEQVVALDGLAIIVHPENPVRSLTIEQLSGIFSGDTTDWAEVGGKAGPIAIYARDNNSGTYDTFKELVLASHGKSLQGEARRFESSEELSDLVAKDPAGIGFIGLPYVRDARAVSIADGNAAAMPPTVGGIATEDYPLARRLYLYTPPNTSNRWVKALASYAQSPEGQAIVAQYGFISQQPQALTVPPTTAMPDAYRDMASRGQRLSVNFRFAEGSATLDNKAQRDIERVINYMQTSGSGKQLALIGFSDDKAAEERAMLLSRLRAMAVRRELFKAGVLPREITGMGNMLPVAANDDDAGRIRNRRVEVWVY